ncbi:hypothetical protein V6Z12_A10G101200 [Gossypium hirsutum]
MNNLPPTMPFTQRTFHCHWRKGLRVFSRGALNFPLFHFTFHCFSRVPVGDPVSSVDWCSQGPLQTGKSSLFLSNFCSNDVG